jgi:hypothetical protein
MTEHSSIRVLQVPLYHGVHIDFLRLRCGSEATFREGLREVREAGHELHSFIVFSEWDAVIIVPSTELYPRTLTEIYANTKVASSVSGTSGYFSYLWKHETNENWRDHLTLFERSGPSIIISLRFADWFRRDVGVGSEILILNYLKRKLEGLPGVHAVTAHSLGWNDVVILIHADDEQARLTKVLADIRLMTLGDCIAQPWPVDLAFSERQDAQIFAASYTHLVGGFDSFMDNTLSFEGLANEIHSALVLVRVAPPHEQGIRDFMSTHSLTKSIGIAPSEMGHYSFSVDITAITNPNGQPALQFIADSRNEIRRLAGDQPDSYAETTTIFRFKEPASSRQAPPPAHTSLELQDEIRRVQELMQELPDLLHKRNVSPMTTHRFISVLTTLLDHLSDPVRSSVVRHLSRFAREIPELVRELDIDGIDDLCHVVEYAIGQAIDGIAQFQHDANALGLSGRGGYSRLIVALEWYIRGSFARLGLFAKLPLITFGLRSGNAGSTGRYQIDVPFNVLFVPSRWHILFHEIGHLAWLQTFGWMMESLAIYREMENEILFAYREEQEQQGAPIDDEAARRVADERAQVEFLRTRETLRELFPNFLMFALPCAGNIEELDALAFRRMLSMRHPYSITRELLLRVVTHCLLVVTQEAIESGGAKTRDAERAEAWWKTWERLDKQSTMHATMVRKAIDSISGTMSRVSDELLQAEAREASQHGDSRHRVQPRLAAKMQILQDPLFSSSAQQALDSVIRVLALRSRHFRSPSTSGVSNAHTDDAKLEQIAPVAFGKFLSRVANAQREQSDPAYEKWMERAFAECLHEGEVITKHRDGFVWSRLLLGSRRQLLDGPDGSFMRSQLAVLLAMWHDAITEMYKDDRAEKRLELLGIVREKATLIPISPKRA